MKLHSCSTPGWLFWQFRRLLQKSKAPRASKTQVIQGALAACKIRPKQHEKGASDSKKCFLFVCFLAVKSKSQLAAWWKTTFLSQFILIVVKSRNQCASLKWLVDEAINCSAPFSINNSLLMCLLMNKLQLGKYEPAQTCQLFSSCPIHLCLRSLSFSYTPQDG